MSKIKKKSKKDSNKKYIILFAITIIIMLALLVTILGFLKPDNQTGKVFPMLNNDNNSTQENAEESEDEEIKQLSEAARIKRYVGIFFENIDDGNYQEAYNKLNNEFKHTYFPTVDDFAQYARKNFRKSGMGVVYKSMERLGNNKTGNMYVFWLIIDDLLQPKKTDEQIEQTEYTNFVVIEYDYNNYELSFSVVD